MDYTPEQRDIIRRIGEVSAEIDRVSEQHRQAQAAAGYSLVDTVTALTNAIAHSTKIGELGKQHGDLWREFLDTL